MQVGATTESVTVSADASLLKTESAEQSSTVGVEKLNDLPLNFGANGNSAAAGVRNALTYVTLVPTGVISSYSSIRVNGAPINTFNVQVEGQSANNARLVIRQDQVQPSVESLEEVSVLTSNFAPEYGQVAGGFVNYIVKSGTNQFHGQFGTAAPYYNDYRYARTPSESASLGRIFRIRENMIFQIRAEFFNVFNRTGMNQFTSTNALASTTRNPQGLLTGGFGYMNTGSVLNPPRNGQIVREFSFE